MSGLTEEQQKRLLLISNLETDQKDYILAGLLGVLDAWYPLDRVSTTRGECAEELINNIDIMIEKAYEKGRYL